MDGPGFHVEIGVLDAAAAGIRQSVADQKGTALEDVDGGSATYGHEGVHNAMETFCDRWNEGLDILVKDAGAFQRGVMGGDKDLGEAHGCMPFFRWRNCAPGAA